MYSSSTSGVRKLPEGQHELSILTTLNEFHASDRTPSLPFLFLLSLSSSPILQSAFNVSYATCNLHYARKSEIREKSPPSKSSGSHEKIDLCVVMQRMSQSYLVKGQTITIRSEWEEKMMLWLPIQLGMWIHTFYSEKKSKILKVRRTCLMYSHFRGELFYFETILLPPASSYIPFKMCL